MVTKPAQQLDEQQMIAAILAGEAHLFYELIRPCERSVYVMALSLLKNEADAEDAAQEAFLKAYRNLASFRGDSKFGTWVISIVLNEARNRLRRLKLMPMESLDGPTDEEGHVSPALLRDWREIPSESLERREVCQALQDAIKSLPPIYRETFLLRDVEGLSIAEAAQILMITVASVKVRLHRARMMLQKCLAPHLKEMQSKRRWPLWS